MLRNKLYVYGDEDVRVPATFNYGQYMLQKFISYKDNVALLNAETGDTVTYRELAEEIVDIALSLVHRGVRKGDVIGICTEKRFETTSLIVGIICAGATFVPIDTSGAAIMLHRLQIAKPKLLFCSHEVYTSHRTILDSAGCIEQYIIDGDDKVEGATLSKEFLTRTARVEDFSAIPVNLMQDNAVYIFSSGTTGLPKAIPMTHWTMLTRMMTMNEERCYTGRPLLMTHVFHAYLIECMHAGAAVVYTHVEELNRFLRIIEKFKVKIAQMMPHSIVELSKSQILDSYDLSSLERIVTCSSPLSAEQLKTIRKRLPLVRVCQRYGITEAAMLCSDESSAIGTKPGSVGCVRPGVTIKIVDVKSREPLGPNQPGELCIKSLPMFSGYVEGDYSDASPYMDDEGFFMTGDVGYYDQDQYFYIVDRIKDIIKCTGETVSPAELEALLLTHPLVSEAGVVGAPHDKYTEIPVAFVVLQPGADVTEQELVDYVDGQVCDYMQLKGGVKFVNGRLPRGRFDKLDRKVLRLLLTEDSVEDNGRHL